MTNNYYTGTDFTTMHPMHWEFWYHMLIPWTTLNWIWLVLIVLVVVVKFNDALVNSPNHGRRY